MKDSSKVYFNTSHVTVYPSKYPSSGVVTFISIHLMLLFIYITYLVMKELGVFQYISCYCLSFFLNFYAVTFIYFNTSHVTVYPVLFTYISSLF